MTTVDVHCHTFNADDLPVRGFVRHVAGSRIALARILAGVIDRVIQRRAVDAEDEMAVLDRLLSRPPGGAEVAVDVLGPAERVVDEWISSASTDDLLLLERAQQEIAVSSGESSSDEGVVERFEDVRRYMRWAALFGSSRWELTLGLVNLYPEVELFTPLLVDLQGLGDRPTTPPDVQIELFGKISLLSMRGDVSAAVHPFVGYDPRAATGLETVRSAVEDHGFIGVKLYPPMGFAPSGNADDPPTGLTVEDAKEVDSRLWELFGWCQAEGVPITTHANPTVYADESFAELSHPDRWRPVLDEHRDLHLNFGHFGWASHHEWPAAICELAGEFDHVYADLGNHHLHVLDETFSTIRALFDGAATRAMSDRLMFGTDWFMVAGQRDHEHFMDRMQEAYGQHIGADSLASFMGGAALRFLGLDDPSRPNAGRLRQRYQDLDQSVPPDWLPQESEHLDRRQPTTRVLKVAGTTTTPGLPEQQEPKMSEDDAQLVLEPLIPPDQLPGWGVGFAVLAAVVVGVLMALSDALGLFDEAAELEGTHVLANATAVSLTVIGVVVLLTGAFLVLADLKRPVASVRNVPDEDGEESLVASATGVAAVITGLSELVTSIGTGLAQLRAPVAVLATGALLLVSAMVLSWQSLPGADGNPTISTDASEVPTDGASETATDGATATDDEG